MERTHEHNITQPSRSASDWWLSRVGDWPKENAATWSAISLLYTELDKQHSLTFLSGVPATYCLRLHRLISQYGEKILHPAAKILHLENKGLKMLHYLVWQQLGAFKKTKGFRGMQKYLQNNRKISISATSIRTFRESINALNAENISRRFVRRCGELLEGLVRPQTARGGC